MSIVTVAVNETVVSVALELRDEFTGGPLLGEFTVLLVDVDGNVLPFEPVYHPAGFVLFLDLPAGQYGIQVDSGLYGLFQPVVFDTATVNPVSSAVSVVMAPRPQYEFPADTTLLRGTVVDQFGSPVQGARVEVEGGEFDGTFGLTDVAGNVVLFFELNQDDKKIDLRISKSGFEDDTINNIEIVQFQTVTFGSTIAGVTGPNTAVITGYVRDAEGTAITGARVEAVQWAQTAFTDPYGRYMLSRDISSPTEIVDIQVSQVGFSTRVVPVSADRGQLVSEDIVLTFVPDADAAILQVEVRDKSGDLSGVLVTILDRDIAAFTNADGIARFYLALSNDEKRESIWVSFEKHGYFYQVKRKKVRRGKTTRLKVRLREDS